MSFMIEDWVIFIAKGLGLTLQYSLVPLLLGIIIGIVISAFQISSIRTLNVIAKVYVSIIRGTPILLQLGIVYYGLPSLLDCNIPAFVAGTIAFSINSGAYISEIIRAGIASIDKGQFEACKTLSIPYYSMMKDIILPQAIRNILPALINEMITLVKETALIATIGEMDLMRRAQIVASEQYNYFAPLMVAGVCYYALISVLSYFAKRLEIRLNAKG